MRLLCKHTVLNSFSNPKGTHERPEDVPSELGPDQEKEWGKPGGAPSTGCIQRVRGRVTRVMGQVVKSLQRREGIGKMSPGEEALEGCWAGSQVSDLSEDTTLDVNTYEVSVSRLIHVVST